FVGFADLLVGDLLVGPFDDAALADPGAVGFADLMQADVAPGHGAVEPHGYVEQPEADRAGPDRSRHQPITYPDCSSWASQAEVATRGREPSCAAGGGIMQRCCSSCERSGSPAAGGGCWMRSAQRSPRAPARSSVPRAPASQPCCAC